MLDSYKDVFQLIRESLFSPSGETTLLTKERTDWEAVFQEMVSQAVAALPCEWLKKYAIPDQELQKRWLQHCDRQQARWIRVMYAQSRLIELLEENSIPCVIIKGSAAAMAYPQPAFRAVGDVDVLVKRDDYQKAASVMEDNGYQLTHEKKDDFHHDGYMKDGVSFELHRRLGIVRESDEKWLSFFERGIEKRVWQTIEGFCFPTLPVKQNGLVLLFHINQHLRSGLGLRQIIDWMMYLNDKEDGSLDTLRPYFREAGLEKLALTVTAMCQKYLGLRTIVEGPEGYPCDELMEYIMGKGNFGRKSGKEGKTEAVFMDMSSPARVFKRLQAGGLCRWKAAKKHKVLRPFAWIYQIGSISRELLRAKILPRKLMRLRKTGLEQRELMRQLGLDVDRTV